MRILVGQHVIWSVNSVCHIFGSRPYSTRDYSTNNFALAIPTFGESWHIPTTPSPVPRFTANGGRSISAVRRSGCVNESGSRQT